MLAISSVQTSSSGRRWPKNSTVHFIALLCGILRCLPMADIVDAITRSRMMSGIRNKNTRPEIAIRKGLHARGFRFRIHVNKLPGKPDIVLPRFRATVFVNGCFWHGHDCSLFKLPSSRQEFWLAKIGNNKIRDHVVADELTATGWRRLVIWECAFRGREKIGLEETIDRAADWIRNATTDAEIRGKEWHSAT